MQPKRFKKIIHLLNWYPPFLGAGIRIAAFDEDFTSFEVHLRARWYNRNLFGTHFGGSLYSMCDPFFVFILIANLGEEYIVWDKTATIYFRKPGKGKMIAIFEIPPKKIDAIREEMKSKVKSTFWFTAQVKNEQGVVVAEVEKEVYIRRKDENSTQ